MNKIIHYFLIVSGIILFPVKIFSEIPQLRIKGINKALVEFQLQPGPITTSLNIIMPAYPSKLTLTRESPFTNKKRQSANFTVTKMPVNTDYVIFETNGSFKTLKFKKDVNKSSSDPVIAQAEIGKPFDIKNILNEAKIYINAEPAGKRAGKFWLKAVAFQKGFSIQNNLSIKNLRSLDQTN